jgi:glycerate kinase
VPLTTDAQLQKYCDVLLAINHEPIEITKAIQNTKDNLVRTAKAIGNLLAIQTHVE